MNKKGKNKKGKVPNPNPSSEEKSGEKIENLEVSCVKNPVKTGDVVENVEEQVKSVKEERVPEILSELISPAVDIKDEESPKKPKRNRGKKKKGKEDEFDDNLEEAPKEGPVEPPTEKIKDDTPKVETEPLDIPIMTPTVRKKKNKKKNAEQKDDEPINPPILEAEPNITAATEEIIKEPVVSAMTEEVTAQPEPIEQEVKSSKKKNKKKKLNDSERSDKEEVSNTPAFKKLAEVKDEPVEMEEKVEDSIIPVEIVKPEPEVKPLSDIIVPESVIEKGTISLSDILGLVEKEPQQIPVVECKSKKKNKKDKNVIPKPEEISPMFDEVLEEPSSLPVKKEEKKVLTEETPKEDISKSVMFIENPESSVQEISPKPKPKIAKPVEKKRKGKQDDQVPVSARDIIAEPCTIEEQVPQAVTESSEVKISEKETVNTETKTVIQNVPIETVNVAAILSEFDFEPLNLSDKAMGKKRKKGAKIPKTPDVSFEILDTKLETDIKLPEIEATYVSKDIPIVTEGVTKEQPISTSEVSEIPIIIDTPIDTKLLEKPITVTEIKDHVLMTPEFDESKSLQAGSLTAEKAEDVLKFETKSSKKRKKSPKPSKKTEIKPNADVQTSKPADELSNSTVTKEKSEKIDASNITKMYDIEISSIQADESEGSACNTVPDITYPRASSQQLLDDNNNDTVIREIFPVQAIISDITKVDTVVKEKERCSMKEEKTDIKSKMMEVNQDMEELRLSIERSLAGLTAIEKGEEAIERKFEEPEVKIEEKTLSAEDTMQIKVQQEKIIEISDVEKCTIEKPIEAAKSADIIQDKDKQIEVHHLTKDIVQQDDIKIIKPESGIIAEQITVCKPANKPSKKKKDKPVIVPIRPLTPVPIEEAVVQPYISTEADIKKAKEEEILKETVIAPTPIMPLKEKKSDQIEVEQIDTVTKLKEEKEELDTPPICPARKDHKNKHKKKKGKQDSQVTSQPTQNAQSTPSSTTQSSSSQETKKEDKTDSNTDKKDGAKDSKEKGKQQASNLDPVMEKDLFSDMDYEPIEKFEDALTSSVDDVNKTFEMIVEQSQEELNPSINITAPAEEKTPVSPPKNLLGHPDLPVPSNRRDYKKEKDKIPNEIVATVKIKDAVDVERKQSKNTQTINKLKDLKDCRMSGNEEFVYKYNFRKVFLQSSCQVCKKDLAGVRVACCYCNLVFYCGIKHKDEDWPNHQALCFAVSTIGHLKDQKHIYADAKNITGHDYRLIRMQMIVSCEKVLKRRLLPWEQEALLYPRMCAHVPCREWRQMMLSDCQGCGQISFCTDNPDHCPKSHARWCKSYSLYQKLVSYQQTKGRLEPRLPTKVMKEQYTIPEKINEVLAGMYEEKIDMNDIQYAALTQLATAPLTAAYCQQMYREKNAISNGFKKATFTIHVVGAELQFEADALNKWEIFFLHLRPDLQELRVVLVNYNLNPSNLPLELLGKIKLCEDCRQNNRRVVFSFQERTYADYKSSEEFVVPDIVCAFNPSIQRSSVYNGKDPWPSTINIILKQKLPFIITAYTITELHKDCIRIKECCESGFNFVSEPKYNNFASVRPDRNFISDDEMPLLFKNYCFAIICG